MANPTTSIYLNQTTPAAPSGDQNIVFQSDNATPMQDITAYPKRMVGDSGSGGQAGTVPPPAAGDAALGKFLAADATWKQPPIGGVAVKTASYPAVAGDTGKLIVFNSSSAVTLTLPSAAPNAQWNIQVQNIGAGALTISPNGLQLDGATSSLSLSQNQGIYVATDGTNYFTERGVGGSGGGGSSNYWGVGEATAGTGLNIITFGSTPLAGSVRIFQDGVLVSPSLWTLSGAVATLTSNTFAVGADIVAVWATTNSTPGGITLTGGSTVRATLRGSNIATSLTNSVTVALPAGSAAGDQAVLFVSSGWPATNPSGWTQQYQNNGITWMILISTKVLTTSDISTGSVTVSLSNSFDCHAALAVFVGGAGISIRETEGNSGSGSGPLNLTTTSAVISTDTGVYFGSNRSSNVPTITPGSGTATLLQSASTANAVTALWDQGMPGGAQTNAYNISAASFVAGQVIVEGVNASLAPPLPALGVLTTAGDLVVAGTNAAPQRLGVGTSGQVLTVVSGSPAWAAAATGAGGGASGLLGAEITSAAGTSVPNSADTTVALATTVKDSGGFTGVNANALTVPAGMAGWYAMTGSVRWTSSGAGVRYLWMKKNGSFTTGPIGSSALTGGDNAMQAAYVAYLNAGDYISLDVFQTSGGTLTTSSSSLSMALLSAAAPLGITQSVDWPPASPTAWDDEFTDGSLNARWSTLGSPTSVVANSRLVGNQGSGNYVWYQSKPSSGASQFDIKLTYSNSLTTGNPALGLCVGDGTKFLVGMYGYINSNWRFELEEMTNYSTWSSAPSTLVSPWGAVQRDFYMRVKDDGTTNLTWYASFDGLLWQQVLQIARTTWLATAGGNVVGLLAWGPCSWSIDWFRRTL